MTAALEPIDGGPTDAPAGRRILAAVRDFDFLDTVGRKLADTTGVPPAEAPEGAPSLDLDLLKRAGAAVLRAPRQHWLLTAFVSAVAAFTAAVVGLLVSGRLGDVYEVIYTWYPGRPWTHVMRDHPWIYVALIVPLAAVPYVLAPPQRWGRAFLTYVIFVIGFLGGHVFW